MGPEPDSAVFGGALARERQLVAAVLTEQHVEFSDRLRRSKNCLGQN